MYNMGYMQRLVNNNINLKIHENETLDISWIVPILYADEIWVGINNQ